MTLPEVLVSLAIFGLVFGSIVTGLTRASYRAFWSGYNTAASKLAEERMEQILNANWDLSGPSATDQVVSASFPADSPVIDAYMGGGPVTASRSVQISTVSTSAVPEYKVTSVQVVWSLRGRGPFTNSVLSIRAPAQ